MTRRPPRDVASVLVYCPAYTFRPIRSISTDLLRWVVDATHWCRLTTPHPAPPTGVGAKRRLDAVES